MTSFQTFKEDVIEPFKFEVLMTVDFTEFLDMTAEELDEDWLNFITTRDPLLQDTSAATFNSILAEAVASEFWIFLQLLKQKVKDSSVLTAEGDALSQVVLAPLPEGRYPGTRAEGVLMFSGRHQPKPISSYRPGLSAQPYLTPAS